MASSKPPQPAEKPAQPAPAPQPSAATKPKPKPVITDYASL